MIFVKLTNGFGNNLFQYIAGRLLAEHHHKKLILIPPFKDYYALNDIEQLNLFYDDICYDIDGKKIIRIQDNEYLLAYNKQMRNKDILLDGYFEDYTFYYDHIDHIKTWFKIPETKNNEDLVFHLRTGDRLFYKAHYDSKGNPLVGIDRIENALNQFDYSKLYIVTDIPSWEETTINEMKNFKFHVEINPIYSIDIASAVNYHNALIKALNKYDPIIQNNDITSDFNFLLSFNMFLFQHSTLAWWAAVIGGNKQVGVYGPWRPYKGKNNKNLSRIPLPGWFQWE